MIRILGFSKVVSTVTLKKSRDTTFVVGTSRSRIVAHLSVEHALVCVHFT